jgi:uncharacterized protein (DUF885 family)
MKQTSDQAIALALVGIERVWAEVRRTPYAQRDLPFPIDRLPDIGEAATNARSQRADEALAILDSIDNALLPPDLAMTHHVARVTAARMSKEAERYWLAFDPLGIGFFALFAPTAYGGGFLLGQIAGMLARQRFDRAGDVDRYLGLIEDYGRLVDQIGERTVGQAARGIRMPQAQLAQSVELMARLRAGAAALVPAAHRLTTTHPAAADRIGRRVEQAVGPAFDRLLTLLDDADYRRRAPAAVGLAQYPGGEALYRELVREHTTLDLTPEQVHRNGIARIDAVRSRMTALLAEERFEGSVHDYVAAIAQNPAWRANGAEDIGAVFRRYINRLEPHVASTFRFKPAAGYDVAPLPEAVSGSMTFGYYDAPNDTQPIGRYLFNAQNLSGAPLANIAALNYHELVPGHHFHMASQRENGSLHPVRATAFFNAFNEGWAEYAATLAGELGMYRTTEEKFGRLMMDAFLACRLVVDTGMNAMGWSLEHARSYMRENAFMPEVEIQSESIRYSCDIPAQSLAYKLGEYFLMDQREVMRDALGDHFDIRDFHDIVLRPGALPLPRVASNVAAAIQRHRGQGQETANSRTPTSLLD